MKGVMVAIPAYPTLSPIRLETIYGQKRDVAYFKTEQKGKWKRKKKKKEVTREEVPLEEIQHHETPFVPKGSRIK